MQIAGAIVILAGSLVAAKIFSHGYANTVEELALRLKRHAKGVREMHLRKSREMNEEWVRELEAGEEAA